MNMILTACPHGYQRFVNKGKLPANATLQRHCYPVVNAEEILKKWKK
ncbi:MAG: hypothetical protein JST82_12650 [Bacteroidetes bacterium]|nr:hypothetical protein [Bacteroidota bacterium]